MFIIMKADHELGNGERFANGNTYEVSTPVGSAIIALNKAVASSGPFLPPGDPPVEGCTWAQRPPASSVPVGTVIYISDVGLGGSRWKSDGTWWRPESGRQTLFSANGSVASPLSTMTLIGGVAQLLPGVSLALPAGLIPANATLRSEADLLRSGAGGSIGACIYFGNANATTDSQTVSLTMTTANIAAWAAAGARVGASRTAYTSSAVGYGGPGTQVWADKACNLDATSYINFGVGVTGTAGDVLNLLGYRIWVEG